MSRDRYAIFSHWMAQHGFIREHKFHHSRKWRLDYAHTGLLIALEVEGGIWIFGKHNRGTGYINDIEKYNAATLAGWALLRCTPQHIESGEAYKLVETALKELDPTKP